MEGTGISFITDAEVITVSLQGNLNYFRRCVEKSKWVSNFLNAQVFYSDKEQNTLDLRDGGSFVFVETRGTRVLAQSGSFNNSWR